MSQLRLTNTLTRKLEDFKSLDEQAGKSREESKVGMYVCGITPYDNPHIGNARPLVVFDVLYRLLKHLYNGKVTYVRNFTDIDDKIIARANEKGENPTALAQHFIDAFHEDADALGCLRPDHEPRVSDPEVMQGIVTFIEKLVEKGAAYTISDGVYLDIKKVDTLREQGEHYSYGQLSGKKLSELIAGARVDVNAEKHNTGDFALWKLAKPGEPSWPSPWGAGRPGWHIECSVMSEQLLGTRFDIHGGGEDLQFPHHENELAQSVSCHGHIHANTWLHNAFITVEGKKMSKSLGNFITIQQARQKYSGEAIRLWLLQTHYRKPVDFSEQTLEATQNRIKFIKSQFSRRDFHTLKNMAAKSVVDINKDDLVAGFFQAMCDDLNTPRALAFLSNIMIEASTCELNSTDAMNNTGKAFRNDDERYSYSAALYLKAAELFMDIVGINVFSDAETLEISSHQQTLLKARETARAAKDWKESDRLRDELKSHGILVEDGPTGTTWRRT